MKKRTRILTALTAATLAVGTMCYGFASWSSKITVDGSVSASGKWSVVVTDADLELSSAGTAAEAAGETASTYTVQQYPVYVDLDGSYYNFRVDDLNAQTVTVTADELAGYDTSIGVWVFTSAPDVTGKDNYTFRLNKEDGVDGLTANWYNRRYVKVADDGASDGKLIGYAIGWCYNNYSTNTPANSNITLTYADAQSYLKENPTKSTYVTTTDTTASFSEVAFSLPGAWANYKVTVTNKGTVNANLSDYSFDFTALDTEVYTVDVPTGFDDEVLAPGESCTFNFVVQVKDTAETTLESAAQSFKITLNYVQDTVDAAPSAGHKNS